MQARSPDPFTLDFDRPRRCGFPEVVYGEGKERNALRKIVSRLYEAGSDVFVTRLDSDTAEVIGADYKECRYNDVARTLRVMQHPAAADRGQRSAGSVGLVTAGTSDLPVAEEARETLLWMGIEPIVIHDVGVAGPHRFPEQAGKLEAADAVVVVAGMEGALPSIVGGYVDCPVIGVPTSVGYGANFAGLSALLSMLNSCASNVAVVNIDAGFKGGYVAGMIARRRHASTDSVPNHSSGASGQERPE